jgi:hypothetical protein
MQGAGGAPSIGPWYGTVQPAEGRPAIVTGCAGVSCPVTFTCRRVGLLWSRRQSCSAHAGAIVTLH